MDTNLLIRRNRLLSSLPSRERKLLQPKLEAITLKTKEFESRPLPYDSANRRFSVPACGLYRPLAFRPIAIPATRIYDI